MAMNPNLDYRGKLMPQFFFYSAPQFSSKVILLGFCLEWYNCIVDLLGFCLRACLD